MELGSNRTADAILYRLKPDWDLPSLSIASIQVEAYLRLANVPFAVQDCLWSSSSPTGQVPALETQDGTLVGAYVSDSIPDEFQGAKYILAHLQRNASTNLDARLSSVQKADLLAFTALVDTKLIPALVFSTWCERDAYSKITRTAYAKGLAFPLNYILPYSARRGVERSMPLGKSPSGLYRGACEVLTSIAGRLEMESEAGHFFFGEKPTSLDALLFASLAYTRSAPAVHPQLQQALKDNPILERYVEHIGTQFFSSRVPSAKIDDLKWSSWKPGTSAPDSARPGAGKQKTEREIELERKGRMWLLGTAAAIAGYIAFSGQYIEVHQYLGELGEDDDGEGDGEY